MVDMTGKVAALQQSQTPPAPARPAQQNQQATLGSAAPGAVRSTESVGAVGNAGAQPQGPQSVPSADELNSAVADLRNSVARFSRSLEFAVDEGSERTVVRVLDTETDEVVRQIPPDEVLALAAQLKEMAQSGADPTGLLLEAMV